MDGITAASRPPVVGNRSPPSISRTPRRAPTRVALHAGAIAHQGEVAAFAAGVALISLGARFRAFFRGIGLRLRARLDAGFRVRPRQAVELCLLYTSDAADE